MAKSPRPGEYPGAVDSIDPDYLPLPVLRLDSPATSRAVAAHSGPPLASARKPEASRAESNRNSLLGPRHTPLDTRLSHARVSPPAPGAPTGQDGTHANNPGNLPRISAPGS